MSENSITVKRVLQPKMTRKVMKDAMFKITIPMDWATFFHLQKGQIVQLELTINGFIVIFFDLPDEKKEMGVRIVLGPEQIRLSQEPKRKEGYVLYEKTG